MLLFRRRWVSSAFCTGIARSEGRAHLWWSLSFTAHSLPEMALYSPAFLFMLFTSLPWSGHFLWAQAHMEGSPQASFRWDEILPSRVRPLSLKSKCPYSYTWFSFPVSHSGYIFVPAHKSFLNHREHNCSSPPTEVALTLNTSGQSPSSATSPVLSVCLVGTVFLFSVPKAVTGAVPTHLGNIVSQLRSILRCRPV